jgi:microcystin-dependent protein
VGVATGTEAASPVDPAIPAGKVPVARINLATSTTVIANSILDDLRSLNLLGLASGATTAVGTAATRNAAAGSGDLLPANGDGSGLTGIQARLTGEVIAYAGAAAPGGWLLCAGQAVSRTAYAALFAVVGTTFGAGDGSTTFNVPDLRGRVPAGKDDMNGSAASRVTSGGSGIAGATLGASGGAETVTLTAAQLPGSVVQGTGSVAMDDTFPNVSVGLPNTSLGSGQAHQNMPPALILNYIVKT